MKSCAIFFFLKMYQVSIYVSSQKTSELWYGLIWFSDCSVLGNPVEVHNLK